MTKTLPTQSSLETTLRTEKKRFQRSLEYWVTMLQDMDSSMEHIPADLQGGVKSTINKLKQDFRVFYEEHISRTVLNKKDGTRTYVGRLTFVNHCFPEVSLYKIAKNGKALKKNEDYLDLSDLLVENSKKYTVDYNYKVVLDETKPASRETEYGMVWDPTYVVQAKFVVSDKVV